MAKRIWRKRHIPEILESESVDNPDIIKMSQSSISTIINKLGYRYLRITKAPVNRNTESARKKRVIWGETFLQLVHNNVQFIFIDESGFCLGMTRTRGYGEVGSTPEVVVEKVKNPNHTVIAGMIVGQPMYIEVISGACDNARFQQFCNNLINHIQNTIDMNRTVVVVMDNATIHRSQIFNIFWSKKIYVLMTVPYSPQCNSVELTFSEAKAFLTGIMGSRVHFSRIITEINQERVRREYERRVSEHPIPDRVQMEEVDVEVMLNMDALFRRFNQWMTQTDEWFEQEMVRSQRTPNDVHPLTDRYEDELFHEIIIRCFREITVQHTFHYFAHTIKVAHSCTRGYPLSNSSKFYDEYNEMDEATMRLYQEFKNK